MSKPQGFGVSLQDGKTRINKKKRPDLHQNNADSAMGATNHSYFGYDAANPPEANSVAPSATVEAGSDSNNNQQQPPIATDPNTGMLLVHPDELNRLARNMADRLLEPSLTNLQEQYDAFRTESDRRFLEAKNEIGELQEETRKATAEADRLRGIFSATGNSIPGDTSTPSNNARNSRYSFAVNTLILPGSMEPVGAAKDFIDAFGNSQYTPKVQVFDPTEGRTIQQVDTTQIDRMMRDPDFRKHVVADMERLFKAHGFLRGGDMGMDNARPGSTGGGAFGSIKDAFLPFLSAYVRTSDNPRYVWWQFNTLRLELGRVPGTNTLVPRFPWLDEPTDEDDYLLDSGDQSENISTESQALSMLTTPIDLFGYGLGKGTKVSNRPVAIPEFIMATSIVDLLQAVDSRLTQNYNSFEDLKIRRVFQQALANPNNIYYNDAGSLTRTPGDVGTGDDGTLTEEALNSLSSEMTTRRIPTFGNGKRVGVLNAKGVAQFKNSLSDKMRATSEAEIQEITSILNAGNLGDGITKVTGYLGTYCGFMLFESGTTGIGEAVGAEGSEGIYNTVLGAGTRLTRDNFFFGPGVVGHGVSLPTQIRMDGDGTFGTKMRFIWRSIEGWGSLDCTSTNTGQQDRVMVLRTTDQPV